MTAPGDPDILARVREVRLQILDELLANDHELCQKGANWARECRGLLADIEQSAVDDAKLERLEALERALAEQDRQRECVGDVVPPHVSAIWERS